MNAEPAELQNFTGQTPPRRGWSLPRLIFYLALALAIHFALVYLFGAREATPTRAVKNAPQFLLAGANGPFAALTDPTLFARPHESLDFIPAAWHRPPLVAQPTIRWTEPPQFLLPSEENLGMALTSFVQTNRQAMQPLSFKPEPQFSHLDASIESTLPQYSSLKIIGNLARRGPLNQVTVPSLPCNDVLPPTKVQVVVDAAGTVVSAVLLESSEWPAADQKALELARTLRFAPALQAALGEIIFTWHTVPINEP